MKRTIILELNFKPTREQETEIAIAMVKIGLGTCGGWWKVNDKWYCDYTENGAPK